MKRALAIFLTALSLSSVAMVALPKAAFAADPPPAVGAQCDPLKTSKSFLGLPHWYEYLDGAYDSNGKCIPQLKYSNGSIKGNLSGLWLIALAILELLLRLAGMVAVGIVIFGGFKYITSQGSPEGTKSARNTIINAMIGLFITILASVSVNFVANNLLK